MTAFYNDTDRYCCDWLRNLADAGHITPGTVDDRSIADLKGDDLAGFKRVHLFAGIAGWDLALQMAGWPEDLEVWTGSCPCQPFSGAGKRKGVKDDRHLWPEMRRLIAERRPAFVFGEQVASAKVVGTGQEAEFVAALHSCDVARINKAASRLVRSPSLHYWERWIDGIRADLEAEGYAFGWDVLGAHSLGAPHIRQRLWWGAVALVDTEGSGARLDERRLREVQREDCERNGGLADAQSQRLNGGERAAESGGRRSAQDGCGLGNTDQPGSQVGWGRPIQVNDSQGREGAQRPSGLSSWHDCAIVRCVEPHKDGERERFRRVPTEPALFPLAHGLQRSLDGVRSIEHAAWMEVVQNAESCQADPDEVLRVVREGVQQVARGQKAELGVRLKLHEAEVLLAFLLCVESARKTAFDRCGFTQAGEQVRRILLRGVWVDAGATSSSCGRKSPEQRRDQLADSLRVLPRILSRHVEPYRQAAFRANASAGRTGQLRAAGNSIVPQVAAEFVTAFVEAVEG